MSLLWRYLRPHRGRAVLALLLAGLAQVLQLVDPLIFGHIVDRYALNPEGRPERELVRGSFGWLAVATGVALVARLAASVQQYVVRRTVQEVGRAMFDDGLRHALRLSYEELEQRSSGEMMALLQKVRSDVERFSSAVINVDDVPANELRYNRVRRRERAAHRLSTIAHADTIFVLERGRIVEQGTHGALVERRGLYFAMWRQQIGERRRETA